MKLRDRRPAREMVIHLNRSRHLEGKPGFYEGRPITSRRVYLPKIDALATSERKK